MVILECGLSPVRLKEVSSNFLDALIEFECFRNVSETFNSSLVSSIS